MSLVDKPDLKTGFWIGLGLLGAFLLLALVQAAYYRAKGARAGGG